MKEEKMAANHRKSCIQLLLLTLTLFVHIRSSYSLVHEINKGSLDKFLKGKLFVLTFVDSPSCSRCRVLFPFYMAASQVFPHDPEIFFTRTHDKKLVMDWGITELPALVYHRQGVSKQEIINIDIMVDDIIDQIARILMGNFAGLTRTYTVHINEKNYDEIIVTPKQNVMLLIYSKPKEEREVIDNFEKVAYAFRKDDAILFATLDSKKYRVLREKRFKSKDTPAVMWLGTNEKTSPKRYGGFLTQEALVEFVNERTGLLRSIDGSMLRDAGRVPEADEIIKNNFENLVEGRAEDLKNIVQELSKLKGNLDTHQQDLLDYYIYTIDTIALAGSVKVVKNLITNIEDVLFGQVDTLTRTEESLKRQKNVLLFFQLLEKEYTESRKRQTKKELAQKLEAKKVKEVIMEHRHVHTEL